MTRSPSVIIIARHGTRLDAADKGWHLTSPAPYDPPLTYGGWTQSRALGARIATLLHQREIELQSGESKGTGNGHTNGHAADAARSPEAQRRRKLKVVVHSSPYLRCVQTSIGISAGIAQFQPPKMATRSGSPNVRTSQRNQPSSHEPERGTLGRPGRAPTRRDHDKTILRIDAFLGEWQSPDYFEHITPPPNSTLMIANAKAELLRRGEYTEVAAQNSVNQNGHFPGGWSKGGSATQATSDQELISKMDTSAHALPIRDRAGSIGSMGSSGSWASHKGTAALTSAMRAGHYLAPTPTYAISASEPIPRGYVAHARDACVDVDYQWDSSREPLNWGDGGEYGEEWSAMHRRFRRGLNSMVDWYNEHSPTEHPDTGVNGETHGEVEDEDCDVALILVTHGAGCNALIGALTNQPVLLDVGMASLTMAVKKEEVEQTGTELSNSRPSSPALTRRSSLDTGLSEVYEMRLVASTEHLRPGVNPAQLPHTGPPLKSRQRYSKTPLDTSPSVVRAGSGVSSALGSIRRGSSPSVSAATSTKLYSPVASRPSPISPAVKSGLWGGTSAPSSPIEPEPSHSTEDMLPNSSNSGTTTNAQEAEDKSSSAISEKDEDDVPALPPSALGRSMSQHGLWGSAPSGARNERAPGMKRRWTLQREG